eukprot:scaffold1239_cov175-Pinguiococcus_pyrenoidosus.AAC.11
MGRVQGHCSRKRLAVKKNCSNGGAEVSVLPATNSIVGTQSESLGYFSHVSRSRVGRREALDQEVRDEYRRVWLVEKVLKHRVCFVLGITDGCFLDQEERRRIVEAHAVAHVDRRRQVPEVPRLPAGRFDLEDGVLIDAVHSLLGVDSDAIVGTLPARRGGALDVVSVVVRIGRCRADAKAPERFVDRRDAAEDWRHFDRGVADAGVLDLVVRTVATDAVLAGLRISRAKPGGPECVLVVFADCPTAAVLAAFALHHVHGRDTAVLFNLRLYHAGYAGPELGRSRTPVQFDSREFDRGAAGGFAPVRGIAAADGGAGKGVGIGTDGIIAVPVGNGVATLEEGEIDARKAAILVEDLAATIDGELDDAERVDFALVPIAVEVLGELHDALESARSAGAGRVAQGAIQRRRLRVQLHSEDCVIGDRCLPDERIPLKLRHRFGA